MKKKTKSPRKSPSPEFKFVPTRNFMDDLQYISADKVDEAEYDSPPPIRTADKLSMPRSSHTAGKPMRTKLMIPKQLPGSHDLQNQRAADAPSLKKLKQIDKSFDEITKNQQQILFQYKQQELQRQAANTTRHFYDASADQAQAPSVPLFNSTFSITKPKMAKNKMMLKSESQSRKINGMLNNFQDQSESNQLHQSSRAVERVEQQDDAEVNYELAPSDYQNKRHQLPFAPLHEVPQKRVASEDSSTHNSKHISTQIADYMEQSRPKNQKYQEQIEIQKALQDQEMRVMQQKIDLQNAMIRHQDEKTKFLELQFQEYKVAKELEPPPKPEVVEINGNMLKIESIEGQKQIDLIQDRIQVKSSEQDNTITELKDLVMQLEDKSQVLITQQNAKQNQIDHQARELDAMKELVGSFKQKEVEAAEQKADLGSLKELIEKQQKYFDIFKVESDEQRLQMQKQLQQAQEEIQLTTRKYEKAQGMIKEADVEEDAEVYGGRQGRGIIISKEQQISRSGKSQEPSIFINDQEINSTVNRKIEAGGEKNLMNMLKKVKNHADQGRHPKTNRVDEYEIINESMQETINFDNDAARMPKASMMSIQQSIDISQGEINEANDSHQELLPIFDKQDSKPSPMVQALFGNLNKPEQTEREGLENAQDYDDQQAAKDFEVHELQKRMTGFFKYGVAESKRDPGRRQEHSVVNTLLRPKNIQDDNENGKDAANKPIPLSWKSIAARVTSRKAGDYSDDDSQNDDGTHHDHADGLDSDGEEQRKANPRFKSLASLFQSLLTSKKIKTKFMISSIVITYDSTKAIVVTKKNEEGHEFWVKQYDLGSYELTFEEKVGGRLITDEDRLDGEDDDYIKVKEIEQSQDGKQYAFVYNNDGRFYLRTFGKENRSQEEIQENQLDINKLLDLNTDQMCIDTLPEPFANCCFMSDSKIYVSAFHTATRIHYHFIYDLKDRIVVGEISKQELDCTKRNFPVKAFFNHEKNEIYQFYRQGQAFIINGVDTADYAFEQITEMDLGQMYLVYNTALMARSSSDILMFKIEKDEETGVRHWILYNSIESRGSISYIKGNVRIQVVNDEKIQFYLINKETLMPELENVMNNDMKCSEMMFGSQVKYGITYKVNQKSFDIHRRKYWHDFKVPINHHNLEGSIGLEVASMNIFCLTKIDVIRVYDSNTFEILDTLPIQLLKTETREPNQIIAMQMCQQDQYLAVISGKVLIMNEQKINQLFILKRIQQPGKGRDKFVQVNKSVLKNIPEFKQVSMNFHFKITKGRSKNTLLFARIDQLFEFNFETNKLKILFRFLNPLKAQPQFFKPNYDQSKFMISSHQDSLYVDVETRSEMDIDDFYQVQNIKETIYSAQDNSFYIVTNKFQEKLGFFILKIDESNPGNGKFLIQWKHSLDIADTNIFILHNYEKGIKELIVGYKVIYLNVYNIISMDINRQDNQLLVFRHESFQLWESECMGLFLKDNLDFVTMSRNGLQVLSLGSHEKKPINSTTGIQRMCHSLESFNFLKIDPDNFMEFECAQPGSRILTVSQEYTKGSEGSKETAFWQLYKLKLYEFTLRELLLIQSIYWTKTQKAIVDIINDQPNPSLFYKSFMELRGTNMASILCFDTRSMEYLLDEKFSQYFPTDCPLFYKNKFSKVSQNGSDCSGKFYYRSAIDSALKCNQVGSVRLIIDYIVKYQNQFISSFLFRSNFMQIVEKGLDILPLLDSQVFRFSFEFDEWPNAHPNDEECLRPYNENLFMIRSHYKTVFPEAAFDLQDEDDESGGKPWKINYTVNFLPMLGKYVKESKDPITNQESAEVMNKDRNLLQIFCEGDLDWFTSPTLMELIQFKWDSFGYALHLFGCVVHLAYIASIFMYVDIVYLQQMAEHAETSSHSEQHSEGALQKQTESALRARSGANGEIEEDADKGRGSLMKYSVVLFVGIFYPALYECFQMCNQGLDEYFSDSANYIDMVYIWGSVTMQIIHNIYTPYTWFSKLFLIVVVNLAIRRTFNFLRIFQALSTIVIMIQKVVVDLNVFLAFYVILIVLFSLLYAVLGLGNVMQSGAYQDSFNVNRGTDKMPMLGDPSPDYGPPMIEYFHMNGFFAGLIATLRLSMGDYTLIDAASSLDRVDTYCFWIIWLITVIVTCIVFLNFIVAEASNSYNEVSEQLEQYVQFAMADMVAEAEGLLPESAMLKRRHWFPRYLISRRRGL